MQKVHRLGKRSQLWLAIPLVIATSATTYLLSPQPTTTTALIATRDIAEGDKVSQADFNATSVQIGSSSSLYPATLQSEGIALKRLVKGQLLNLGDLAATEFETRIPVVIDFKDSLPSGLRAGSQVDLWATYIFGAEILEPSAIATECAVTHFASTTDLGQKVQSVEFKCSPEFIPAILKAQAAKATIALVLKPTLLEQ